MVTTAMRNNVFFDLSKIYLRFPVIAFYFWYFGFDCIFGINLLIFGIFMDFICKLILEVNNYDERFLPKMSKFKYPSIQI